MLNIQEVKRSCSYSLIVILFLAALNVLILEKICTNHILLDVLYMIPNKNTNQSSLKKHIQAYPQEEKNINLHNIMLMIIIYLKT